MMRVISKLVSAGPGGNRVILRVIRAIRVIIIETVYSASRMRPGPVNLGIYIYIYIYKAP